MAARSNTTTQEDVVRALDADLVESFTGEYDRLAQTIGLFSVETVAAGTAIVQKKIKGSLVNQATTEGSSGTAYVEGDFVIRSKYEVDEDPIGKASIIPYAKQTTGDAILKAGFENAITRTDRKAVQQVRSDILTGLFALLANGTTKAEPDSGAWNLQQVLAYTQAALGDALESNDEANTGAVFFINRTDAAKYLAEAAITTQETFGMSYLETFLGVQNVLLTSKVPAGTVYATPAENIHVYGIDFATLAAAGLDYATDDYGLIGVAHRQSYDYVSAETHIARGALMVPEVKDFIAIGKTAKSVTTGGGE